MKHLFKSKFVIPFVILIFATGAATYAIAKNQQEKKQEEALWRDDFHHSFFGKDFFAEMEEMDKRMNKIFAKHRKMMAKMIKDADKSDKKSNSNNSLALYNDEGFYRYELTFNSFKKDDVVVAINDRVLTVSAKSEKSEKKKDKENFHSTNNFFYSLTIPADAESEPQIIREDKKITIKLKKIEQKS